MKNKGWRNESRRHSLASKGIKTAQKIPRMFTTKPEESQALQKIARSYGQRIKYGWKEPQGSGFIEDDIVSIGVNSDGSIAYEFGWGSQNIMPSELNLREQQESINWLKKRKVKLLGGSK